MFKNKNIVPYIAYAKPLQLNWFRINKSGIPWKQELENSIENKTQTKLIYYYVTANRQVQVWVGGWPAGWWGGWVPLNDQVIPK